MKKVLLSLLLICFISAGCATVYNPATQRREFIFINTKNEVDLGKAIAQDINRQLKISQDQKLIKRLKDIGSAVTKASDRQDLEYQFAVVEDKQINAFTIPGGFIYVNSALLDIATDDELACVLAHEIGHIAAKHGVKRLQVALGYQIVMSIAFSRASSVDLYRATNIVYDLIALGYSREDERLADRLAVKYAFKSGYNPKGMVSFMYKLKEENDKKGQNYKLVFLSSHPPIEERIKNIEKEIESVEKPFQHSHPER